MTFRKGFLLPLMLLAGCATNQAPQSLTATGLLVEQNGNFFLVGSEDRYHLNAVPQLEYERYLGRELIVLGEIPRYCHQAWEDALVQVPGGSESADLNKVDWSDCLEVDKVSLVTADGSHLVYDWEEIEIEDYYF